MSIVLSVVVIGINIFFVGGTIAGLNLPMAALVSIYLAAACYAVFCSYLALHLYVSLGNKSIENKQFIKKYVIVEEMNKPKVKA